MKVIKQSQNCLVVEDFAWRVGLIFFTGGLIYCYLLSRDGDPLWQSILAVGAFGFLGWWRAYRQLIIFDRSEGFVHIDCRRVGWHRRHSKPLAEITAVELVEWKQVSDPTTWRIELKMGTGSNLPLLWEFTTKDEQYRPVANEIGKFLEVPVVEREGRD